MPLAIDRLSEGISITLEIIKRKGYITIPATTPHAIPNIIVLMNGWKSALIISAQFKRKDKDNKICVYLFE